MVTKTKNTGAGGASNSTGPDLAGTVKDSAQQIWLAGLGAFAKAQEEGSKVFDTLVKEGMSMQRKTQTAAGEKLSEASSRMASMATEITSRASGQWDKLESIFETRVSKALAKLDIPTAKGLAALSARIDELDRKLAAGAAAAKRPAKKSAAKTAAKSRGGRKSD